MNPPAYGSCFFTIKTKCGILEIASQDLSSNHKYEFIEFENGHIYTGKYSKQSETGPPADDMPARSEPFAYDDDRNVWQGRFSPDSSYHYWGSLTQGTKAPINGDSCAERTTYLIVTATSKTSKVDINLKAVSFTKGGAMGLVSSVVAGISLSFLLVLS